VKPAAKKPAPKKVAPAPKKGGRRGRNEEL